MRPFTTPILALACVLAGSSLAHAAGTLEQRRACRADAMRFCRQFVPNVPKITACMEQNIKKLSPACRAQFR
ncbi:hypothetical protein X566_02425 [Afipia sp. P52-10]|jgi:type II secretory pathway component PulL|uniref:hypothetical protein n=1 Tax=Afipia sp. P52-10 TaxID=1429916 RepID=UPI0003DF3D67|nr:hypothetical protein [Afipia sp. P52-10]ETR76614.1 hypothetical protein X566_02425 [Afipia sp. P52-10]